MGAPKGNQFWKQRTKHGRDKIFSEPEFFWEAAIEYFEWCDDNPWHRTEAVKAGDHFGQIVKAPTARPYSISGLCLFLDIDDNTFDRYCKDENYKDFWEITNKIKRVIQTQQWEGATVGAFKENIIARSLGLADKSQISGDIVTEVKIIKASEYLNRDSDQ